MKCMQRKTARRLLKTGWAVWGLTAFGCGFVLLGQAGAYDLCEVAPQSYTYGEKYWSFVPPGSGCRYATDQQPFVGARVQPPAHRLITAEVLMLTGAGLVVGTRAYRRRYPPRARRDRVLVQAD